jgi:hypothetical protein
MRLQRHIALELSYKKVLPVSSSTHHLIPSGEPIPGGSLASVARFRLNSTLKNNYKILFLNCPKNGGADTRNIEGRSQCTSKTSSFPIPVLPN